MGPSVYLYIFYVLYVCVLCTYVCSYVCMIAGNACWHVLFKYWFSIIVILLLNCGLCLLSTRKQVNTTTLYFCVLYICKVTCNSCHLHFRKEMAVTQNPVLVWFWDWLFGYSHEGNGWWRRASLTAGWTGIGLARL